MKYRLLNIVAILALVILLLADHSYAPVPWWVYTLLIWAYLSLIFYGCVRIGAQFFMPVLCGAKTNKRVVTLTFDDGPHPTISQQILDTLKRYDVPVVFFCIGKNISGNETILQRMRNEGHLVGNHSFSHHFWFDLFGAKKMLVDMQQMDDAVVKVTGSRPLLFRPPYGVINPNLKKAIIKGGYTPIGWNVRSFDTTIKDKQKLLLRITDRIRPGAIILLHDSMQITADILPELIENIKSMGYKIERPDNLLNIKAYA